MEKTSCKEVLPIGECFAKYKVPWGVLKPNIKLSFSRFIVFELQYRNYFFEHKVPQNGSGEN